MRTYLRSVKTIGGSRGFSLVEMMLTVAMLGVVGLAISDVTLTQFRIQKWVTDGTDAASYHAIALQQAHNMAWVETNLILMPDHVTRNLELDRCLLGRPKAGDDCRAMAVTGQTMPNVFSGMVSTRVSSAITGSIVCTASNICTRAEVTVTTTTTQTNTSKSSTVSFAGPGLVPTAQLEFSCPAGSVYTAVDLSSRTGSCTPIVDASTTQCSGSGPLSSFGANKNCQTLESKSCASGGVNSVGLFSGESTCAGTTAL